MLVSEKPKRYRPTRPEIRARRALVAHLRPQFPNNASGILAEIVKHPAFKDKPVDLMDIFHDLAYIQRRAGDYIAAEFLPNLALEYQDYVNLCRNVVAESLRRYKEGETETRIAETPEGTVTTTIHREGSYHWLALTAQAQGAILKVANSGEVTKQAGRIMQEFRRLKDLEKEGSLQVATVEPNVRAKR